MAIGTHVRKYSFWLLIYNVFLIYFKNFRTIFGVCIVFLLPGVFLINISQFFSNGILFLIAYILYFLSYFFSSGVLAITIHDICVDNQPSISTSFFRAKKYAYNIVKVGSLELIIFMLGTLLLIIPGIILLIRYAFATSVVVVEQKIGWKALKRSSAIAKGSFWRIFGTYSIIGLVVGLLQFITWQIFGISMADMMEMTQRQVHSIGQLSSNQIFYITSNTVFGVLAAPLLPTSMVLLYYHLRCKNEDMDIEDIGIGAITLDPSSHKTGQVGDGQ